MKKIVPIIFVIFILVQVAFTVQGQRLKYKDIYEQLLTKKPEEVYSLLQEYQKKDPLHVNTYFQLGVISQKWTKDYDPLIKLEEVNFFIYNTDLYFGLAKSKLTEKEIRKNKKYYRNVESITQDSKLSIENLSIYIDKQLDNNRLHEENILVITDNYEKSVSNYNKCVEIYLDINRKYNKLKDIYMMADQTFLDQLESLSSTFDSTLYYFQEYSLSITNYPINEYRQKMNLIPIVTYRLDGLTSSDFLQNEISVWDYRSWVAEIRKVLDSDIQNMRDEIEAKNKKLNAEITELKRMKTFDNTLEPYKVDEKIVYKIGKYDPSSLIISLFMYKESLIDFLTYQQKKINNLQDTTMYYSLERKGRYYQELIRKMDDVDSLGNHFSSLITEKDVAKYNTFVIKSYTGISGFRNYSNNENRFLEKELKESLGKYIRFIYEESVFFKGKTFDNEGDLVPFEVSILPFDSLEIGQKQTTAIKRDKNGKFYIAGVLKNKETKGIAYIAFLDKRKNVLWYNEIPASGGIDYPTCITATTTGCFVNVHAMKAENASNIFYRFDKMGNKLAKKDLPHNEVLRTAIYDNVNEKLFLAFKGTNIDPLKNIGNTEDLIISEMTTSGVENWKTILKLKGNFVDMNRIGGGFFVVANYTEYIDNGGSLQKTSGSDNGVFVGILASKGELKDIKSIKLESSAFVLRSVKLNSEEINLVGVKKNSFDIFKSGGNQVDIYYSILNKEAEVIYEK